MHNIYHTRPRSCLICWIKLGGNVLGCPKRGDRNRRTSVLTMQMEECRVEASLVCLMNVAYCASPY